jgi:hypothetical protein
VARRIVSVKTGEATQADGAAEPSTEKVYQLKISIADSRPVIWRRVLVRAHSTLDELHYVIQLVMGWENSHLHQFESPGPGETTLKTGRSRRTSLRFVPTTDPLGEPFDLLMEDADEDTKSEEEAFLDAVAPAAKYHFLYTYDMGDNWEHDILVEKILPAAPEGVYPFCIDGERNHPLEDSGGIWGYESLLAVLADPSHEDHKEMKSWLREVFGVRAWDGDAFDLAKINKRLKPLQPKPKRTSRR